MRVQWIVTILSILVSMGLLMIILGQRQVLTMLQKGKEKLQLDIEKLDRQLASEDLFKAPLEKLLVQGTKVVEGLEFTVAKIGPEVDRKKTENDACQGEKKKRTDELASMQKQHTETEATLKSESDAWKKEIDMLKTQLTEYRPICAYVKKGALAMKLCGINTYVTTQQVDKTQS